VGRACVAAICFASIGKEQGANPGADTTTSSSRRFPSQQQGSPSPVTKVGTKAQ
jgi:hypothetical protein